MSINPNQNKPKIKCNIIYVEVEVVGEGVGSWCFLGHIWEWNFVITMFHPGCILGQKLLWKFEDKNIIPLGLLFTQKTKVFVKKKKKKREKLSPQLGPDQHYSHCSAAWKMGKCTTTALLWSTVIFLRLWTMPPLLTLLGTFCPYSLRWHLLRDTGLNTALPGWSGLCGQAVLHSLSMSTSRESCQRWKHFFSTFFVGIKKETFSWTVKVTS